MVLSYSPAIYGAGLACLLAAVLAFLLPRTGSPARIGRPVVASR